MSARGFAQSDKPPMGYSLRQAVGDVSGMIRALGHGKATVVATGTSARVATALAANYPERVRSLILCDPIARPHARSLLLARAATRFPDTVARWSLPSEAPDTQHLRALSYQIGGTAKPRLHHAKLASTPLPLQWSNRVDLPVRYASGMPFLFDPDGFAATIAQGAT